ncbi:Chitinase [Purpureocillium takamizusanense]|uniref:chitinase n=1 Tax=Purpureocillium takamizusanense TaxID=2060973 RepID=A0A9Q8V918_9HYPO|nr:Chitinase [Purpureocillium takamizusanense]UNI17268.1 Chitinase [Purpureocillium takamizusanense]
MRFGFRHSRSPAPAARVNAAYYPSWRAYKDKTPASLDVESMTHVFYAFIGVNEDGSLKLLDEYADLQKPTDGQQGCLAALAELKRRHPHIKTLVSVGGANASAEFPALAAREQSRRTFAAQIREFCDRHSFDGVDVDWEHPKTTEEGRDFVKLLHSIRRALPPPQYLLTTALPVGEYCLRNIDLAEASRHLDFLNLMAYDFTGPWTEVCGHHAQLRAGGGGGAGHHHHGHHHYQHPDLATSGAAGVEYVISRRVPAGKILLGIPAYARFFPDAAEPGQGFGSGAGEIDYCDLPQEWIAKAHVDEARGAASLFEDGGDGGGKRFFSFDVPRTVMAKARYTQDVGLGGLFFWNGAGDMTGELSLVKAAYGVLVEHL